MGQNGPHSVADYWFLKNKIKIDENFRKSEGRE
jgi:hypothetical protein